MKLKTHIILIDISIGDLRNLELIDAYLNGLANSVKARTGWKVSRRVLEFAFVSIVSETTDAVRLHGEGWPLEVVNVNKEC